MGQTLENKQINETYKGLIKTNDNAEITGEVEIADGIGTSTGIRVNNDGTLKTTTSIDTPTINATSGIVLSKDNLGGALELVLDNKTLKVTFLIFSFLVVWFTKFYL